MSFQVAGIDFGFSERAAGGQIELEAHAADWQNFPLIGSQLLCFGEGVECGVI